jgi:hypothetical protein
MPVFGEVVEPLESRFWSKVDRGRAEDCWLWRGAGGKYGFIWVDGETKYRGAHRVSYQIAHGAIPDGMLICHSCDTPMCVNPSHLFAGTPMDNNRDMIQKGRNKPTRGERNGMAKLTWAAVAEIRASGDKSSALALRYGVSQRTVRDVRNNAKWRSLNGDHN